MQIFIKNGQSIKKAEFSFKKNLQVKKISLPLQSDSERPLLLNRKKYWRDGRVVECGGLENR